jgi:hypothetical protein
VRVATIAGLLTIFALGTISTQSEAATVQAATCSRAHVADAVAAASAGDMVQIPAGTCSWTSMLTITKGITLSGAGIDQTVLVDNVPRSVPEFARLLAFAVTGANWRLTGLTITAGANTTRAYNGAVEGSGDSKAFRIDNVKFNLLYNTGIRLVGDLWGVVDHCQFTTFSDNQAIKLSHSRWGGIGQYGDNSWATPTNLGTQAAIFIEDNTFTSTTILNALVDGYTGARVVARYNVFNDAAFGNHGTESTGRDRSARSYEVYNNTFRYAKGGGFTAIYLRGGTGVVFNNTIIGFVNAVLGMNYRSIRSFAPWGQCDGGNAYDGNQQANGYPCIDQVGRGMGILMSGNPALPLAWSEQALEPVYVWGNTTNGAKVDSQTPDIVQVGRELLVGVQKQGYVPFVYPHPLVSGAQSGLSAPSNLTIH